MYTPDVDMSKTIENLYNYRHYFSALHKSSDRKYPEIYEFTKLKSKALLHTYYTYSQHSTININTINTINQIVNTTHK
jgi:hypothetical protein